MTKKEKELDDQITRLYKIEDMIWEERRLLEARIDKLDKLIKLTKQAACDRMNLRNGTLTEATFDNAEDQRREDLDEYDVLFGIVKELTVPRCHWKCEKE